MEDREIRVIAQEMTDLEMYRRFIKNKHKGNEDDYEILSTPPGYSFDVIQTVGGEQAAIELKTRMEYSYEQFNDIYFEKSKVINILMCAKAFGYSGSFFCTFYPKSDKVVIISFNDIEWDKVWEGTHPILKIGWEWANKRTANSRSEKTLKEVVYFPLKHTDNITYVYSYPGLKEEYNTLYKQNKKKVISSGDGF